MSRRALFAGSAAGAAAAVLPAGPAGAAAVGAEDLARSAGAEVPAASAGAGSAAAESAGKAPKSASGCASYRAAYHFTVPEQWKNDAQRPVWIDGEYHYYYLYNADYLAGRVGTAWRLATSTDLVSFRDRGIAVPKDTTPNGDVWSGSAVVDTEGTAGFGAGAVVVIATMSHDDGPVSQAQYLYYSTDGGRTFTDHGTDPVLPNPGVRDFRDPKVIRDEERGRWVMALAEGTRIGFYHSHGLTEWTSAGAFVKEGLGVLECPDLFRIATADGTAKWVLGASANGKGAGLPNTYAYWTGEFDGSAFTPDTAEPQWLDHGFDWYGAVTFDKRGSDGSTDPATRYALGWMNNWDYPDITPTIDTDGFNGTDSIVREITLKRTEPKRTEPGGFYLASRPVPALDQHVSRTVRLGDLEVDGTRVLNYAGTAYELTAEVTWDRLTGAGVQLRRSADGSRHIDAGVYADHHFVNRRGAVNPDMSGRWQESHTPFDPSARRVRLRVLVDRTTVEVFFDDGRYTHSMEAFPYLVDTGLALFSVDGKAVFRNVVIREFAVRPGVG